MEGEKEPENTDFGRSRKKEQTEETSPAVFPGYLAGALGFRAEIGTMDRGRLARQAVVTLAGGLAGALLLMVSSNELFSKIVPGLLLFATLVFLFGERLRGLASGLAGWCALAAQGVHLGQESVLAEGQARALRGIVFVRYATRHGYKSYAKGGWNGSWPSNNEDWSESWASGRGFRLPCRWGLGDCLLSGLTGARVDTLALLP